MLGSVSELVSLNEVQFGGGSTFLWLGGKESSGLSLKFQSPAQIVFRECVKACLYVCSRACWVSCWR